MTSEVVSSDYEDAEWLADRIADVSGGIDAAIEIAANWYSGRCVGRLHPGIEPGAYLRECVGPVRFEKADIRRLIAETKLPNTQIAAIAGVDRETVARHRDSLTAAMPQSEPRTVVNTRGQERPATLDPRPFVLVGTVVERDPIPDIYFRLLKALREVDNLRVEALRENAVFLLDVPDAERARLTKLAQSVEKIIDRLTMPEYRLS